MARGQATTSVMYRKIMHTRAENERARIAAEKRREKCPLEAAKRYLRHIGYPVYSESVTKPKSRFFICGQQKLTRKQLIEYADEMRERRLQWRMVG